MYGLWSQSAVHSIVADGLHAKWNVPRLRTELQSLDYWWYGLRPPVYIARTDLTNGYLLP